MARSIYPGGRPPGPPETAHAARWPSVTFAAVRSIYPGDDPRTPDVRRCAPHEIAGAACSVFTSSVSGSLPAVGGSGGETIAGRGRGHRVAAGVGGEPRRASGGGRPV